MTLTRKERESLVIDLLNKCTPIREIATQAGLSFRDIGAIKKKTEEEKEASKEQAERMSQHHSLARIYEEIKDDIGYFVKLYRLAKVARMGVEQVVRLLEIANNDLPVVEHRYERSKRELDSIEAEKQNSARLIQELTDQISTMRKILDQHQLSCKEQRLGLTKLQMQKVRLKALVDNFQNNNEEYIKIRNTAEEKVHNVLSDRRMLLKVALLFLTESMRKDPDKFNAYIFYDNKSSSSTTQRRGYGQYSDTVPFGQQQQQYQSQDCMDVLLEEAEKLYNKLAKELVDESIIDYDCNTSSSLPLLQPTNEEEEQPRPLSLSLLIVSFIHDMVSSAIIDRTDFNFFTVIDYYLIF
jgi:hypothetical protein